MSENQVKPSLTHVDGGFLIPSSMLAIIYWHIRYVHGEALTWVGDEYGKEKEVSSDFATQFTPGMFPHPFFGLTETGELLLDKDSFGSIKVTTSVLAVFVTEDTTEQIVLSREQIAG